VKYKLIGVVVFFLLLVGWGTPRVFSQSNDQFSPDEVLVKLKDGVSEKKRGKLHQSHKAAVRASVTNLNVDVVRVDRGKVKDKVSEYLKDPLSFSN